MFQATVACTVLAARERGEEEQHLLRGLALPREASELDARNTTDSDPM